MNNRTQVVMEHTSAKHPVLNGKKRASVMIIIYCAHVCVGVSVEGSGVFNIIKCMHLCKC